MVQKRDSYITFDKKIGLHPPCTQYDTIVTTYPKLLSTILADPHPAVRTIWILLSGFSIDFIAVYAQINKYNSPISFVWTFMLCKWEERVNENYETHQ